MTARHTTLVTSAVLALLWAGSAGALCPPGDLNGDCRVNVADLQVLATEIAELPRLRLRGLMCLPAIREDFAEQRKPFAALRELLESLNSSGLRLDTLSMGMSADYAAAIHEGATIVRVGTAIFGERE